MLGYIGGVEQAKGAINYSNHYLIIGWQTNKSYKKKSALTTDVTSSMAEETPPLARKDRFLIAHDTYVFGVIYIVVFSSYQAMTH